MLEFLPEHISAALKYVNLNRLYEIRLRADKPVTVNYEEKYRYLCAYGVTDNAETALSVSREEISNAVFSAGKFSVYSVEEQLKRGFVTAECGERIGLAGEYVFEKGNVLTVRNCTSLCIRIPHEIKGCGEEIYRACLKDRVRSILVMSPPGQGKTTILRDLSCILSKNTAKNILICDERGEISSGDTGETSDVLTFADKETAFEVGIRTMRPDIMITDELSAHDLSAVSRAIWSGVKVIASAHFAEIADVKPPFLGAFERYILLSSDKIGKIRGVYDEQLNELPLP